MDTSESKLYSLLRTKEIIAILDGDTKYGFYETSDGQQVPVSMPYLSGPDLCGLSTFFGLPVNYSWGGTNLSRWMYLDNLLEYCIDNKKCSDLLRHMFSIEQFKGVLKQKSPDDIECVYDYMVKTILNNINGVLYFGGHELVVESNKYFVRPKKRETVVSHQPKIDNIIQSKVEDLVERGEGLKENHTYTNDLHRSLCESWMGEINIINQRHLKNHPLHDSIFTTFFHRKNNSSAIIDMLGILKALLADTEYWGIDTVDDNTKKIHIKSIKVLLTEDILRCKKIIEGKVDENSARLIYTEITARYDSVIPEFGNGLYSYYVDQHFYDPELSLDALKHNMLVLTQKMTMYLASKYEKLDTTNQEVHKVNSNKIFIVHGHDEIAKIEVARTLEKSGFEAIILHEQADGGLTIIEKIEKYSDVAFAVVLYTECDMGRAKDQDPSQERYRARQNVVFEHGYLIGKLGRKQVSAFIKGNVETPGDISGVVYTNMDEAGAWKQALAKNMIAAGLNVDIAKMIM